MIQFVCKLKSKYYSIKRYVKWLKYLRFPFGEKAYLIGTPDHINIGDSAIALAEIKFLSALFGQNHVKEITVDEFTEYEEYIKRIIKEKDILFGHGGGNIGTLWYDAELFRYRLFLDFPINSCLIFPQTVHFSNDEWGRKAICFSCENYEKKENLVLVARDRVSFETINWLYKNSEKYLAPDIVLSTTACDYDIEARNRKGILVVFRNDIEKKMNNDDQNGIFEYFKKNNMTYKETDMYSGIPVTKSNRLEVVRKKMQEFADSELVLTDRLHGMVFAAITGTPCIVFSNNHHKVKGSYEWISYLPYIKYVETVDEAIKFIPELISMKNCVFDNSPLMKYYDELAKVVHQYVD